MDHPFYILALYLHLLGWVLWLGTDVGVIIGTKFTENTELSTETRLTILKLAMILDVAPRIMVPLVFATGLYMQSAGLGINFPSASLGIAISIVWFGVVIINVFADDMTKLGAISKMGVLAIQGLAVIGMGGAAIASLAGSDIFPTWLALKWLTYAWIAAFAIGIDVTFKPAIRDYMRLQSEGASDEVNASLSKNLKPVYVTVLAVYVGTMVAAFFGVAKPIW
ncbi:MAG: hypothetical protein AAGK17_11985 [Pseudomonadota bacterium]